MKKILEYISMYGWGYKRPETKLNYLVVDLNRAAQYNGALSHYEAYKTDEFETLEQAQEYIEDHVSKNDLKYIRVYKKLDLPLNPTSND